MKALVIGGVITIATGTGIYFLAGGTTLALCVLVPIFLTAPILTVGISLVMGALDGIGDVVSNLGTKFDDTFGKQPTTVQAN